MATINEIKQQAEAVKNATQVGENTAMRVGSALSGLADIAKQHDVELAKKFDKESVVQESGNAEDKVMSQKAVSDKLSDLYISTNNISIIDDSYFDLSNFTEAENVETNKGLYGFGQGLNDTPLHPTASFTKKFSKSVNNDGVYLYLKGCRGANREYRTYAVYDKNGKLIKEGVSTTNVVLYIERSFTVLAFCDSIYYANLYVVKANSINEKIISVDEKTISVDEKARDLFNDDACVNVIDNCQGIDISKLGDASSVVTKCEINGIYVFGQAIDEEPAFKNDNHKTYKIEISKLNDSSRNRVLFYVKNLSVANNIYRSWAVYAGDNNKLIKEGTATFSKSDTAFFITGIRNWYSKITILISCVGDGVFYYSNINQNFKYDIQKHINQLEAKPLITKLLTGKTVWTLWDSLGENTWQSYFSDLSGANFLSNLNVSNVRPISQGGTTSMPDIDTGTQARARNLVYYKNTHQIDIVFIENINDRNVPVSQRGTIEDKPFMRSQKITYNSDKTLTSYDEAVTYWNNNFDKIVESIDSSKRLTGSMIAIPYTSGNLTDRGSKFTIKSIASKEGDITINLNGRRSVHVTPSMTIDEIVDAFKIYSWGSGWKFIKLSNNSFSVVYYISTSVRGTFDGADTGVTADVVDTGANSEKIFYFTSKNISTWSNKENWSDSISLYSAYKGLIEYLRAELPNAMLYFVMPFSVNVNFNDTSSLKNEDGTWSQDKFVNSGIYKTMAGVNDVQKEVCNYYGIQYLDLVKYGGIGINNIENFFYSNNVHPKIEGYKKYSEMIYKLLPK